MYQHIHDRQCTNADIMRNPLIHACWLDYVNEMRDRLIAQSYARWRRLDAQRSRGIILSFPAQRLVCAPDDETGGDVA